MLHPVPNGCLRRQEELRMALDEHWTYRVRALVDPRGTAKPYTLLDR